MAKQNIIVSDLKTGDVYPNLVGVFARQFPLAVSDVVRTGKAVVVGYYGRDYEISVAPIQMEE